jgi:Protein of unknown function (DUF1566)
VGVGVLVSSGDTSSTTRNAALVVATPCTKPGQVTKVSKQSVVCATTNTGSLWYATMKAKGKTQPCTKPGAIRQKSNIVWVCGVIKKKKLWQATQPLTALAAKEDLPSTTPATPEASVIADNGVLADPKIPDDKIVTQVIDTAATQTLAPAVPAALSLETQPSGGVNAVALETKPVMQLLDQRGTPISTAGITITAVSGRADVVLSGNTAVTDATGRATFTTLSLTGIMGDVTLTFTTPGLDGITSDKFVLAAGAATQLVISTTIGSVVSGKAFDQQPVLHFEDSSANVIAASGTDIIVTSSSQGLSGATTVATNKKGVAGFTDLALTQAVATTLTFTSGELSTTTEVTVVAGDYTTVKITTEASEAATNNTAFSRSPVVQLFDAEGNEVTTADIVVTATITRFPTADTAKAATLLNPTATTNAQGIATFTGLGIKGLIGSYTLGFTPTNGVTQASEKTTILSAGVATQLIVLTPAPSPVGDSIAGTWSLTQSPVIGLRDISNNPVKKENVTVTAIVTGQAPTTAQTNAEGKATIQIAFNGDSAGARTIRYSALSLQTAPTTITLPLLTPVVTWPVDYTGKRCKCSAPFTLPPPTSNRPGAWTYRSSATTVATVNRDSGLITLLGVAGTTTITATQVATPKYAQNLISQALQITDGYNIGEPGPGGGIVFYVAATQQSWGRYLEAAPTDYKEGTDARTLVEWGCYGYGGLTDATAIAIGTGKANTDKIRAKCTTIDIAADVANKYSTTSTAGAPGAAGQWFLPSKDELNELCKIYSNGRTDTTDYSAYQNGCTGNTSPTGGFASFFYWSSSENSANGAWAQNFDYGGQNDGNKLYPSYVRPVRAF